MGKERKLVLTVKEFNKIDNTTDYDINGIDNDIALYYYRNPEGHFLDLPKGDYEVLNLSNNQILRIKNPELLKQVERFQIGYLFDFTSSDYNPEFGTDVNVLKDRYNELYKDVQNMFKYVKENMMVADGQDVNTILPQLDTDEVWVKTEGGYRGFKLGDIEANIAEFWKQFDEAGKLIIAQITQKANEQIEVLENFTQEKIREINEEGLKLKITQSNHGFIFTPVQFDKTSGQYKIANKENPADGMAIKIDNNNFYFVSNGIIAIPEEARDSLGNEYQMDEYYFIDDNGCTPIKPIDIFQSLFAVINKKGVKSALIEIGDPINLMPTILTDEIDSLGLATVNQVVLSEPTIAKLQASRKYKVGDVVQVQGYYSAGDGGGHLRQKKPEGYIGEDAVIGADGSIWGIVFENKSLKFLDSKNKINKNSQEFLRIPNILKFNNNLYVAYDKREGGTQDIGLGTNISISYSVFDKKLNTIISNSNIFECDKVNNINYSDCILYIVNNEIYCMSLKYTGNREGGNLTYSNGDIVYKKSADGINWSSEISIKSQLSDSLLVAPSPTRAIIYQNKVIIPNNEGGYTETSDGVNYRYVNLNSKTWENTIEVYGNDIVMFGRNELTTSKNFLVFDNIITETRNSGYLSNGGCCSCIKKIKENLYIQTAQNNDNGFRTNLIYRIFTNPTQLPVMQGSIFDISDCNYDFTLNNKDFGYSCVENIEDTVYICYEFDGDVFVIAKDIKNMFGESVQNINPKIIDVRGNVTTDGILDIRQDTDTYCFYRASNNVRINEIRANRDITLVNDGDCAIEYKTNDSNSPVINEITHPYKINVFSFESIKLKKSLNNTWSVVNISQNRTIQEVNLPSGSTILDLTNISARVVKANRISYTQTGEITEILNFKNGREIIFSNLSTESLVLNLNFSISQQVTIKGFCTAKIEKHNDKIYVTQYTQFPNSILSLDTPYYTAKMQERGIYADYVNYRDELHAYENSNNVNYKSGIMSLNIIEEPTIPKSVEEFAKEYNLI